MVKLTTTDEYVEKHVGTLQFVLFAIFCICTLVLPSLVALFFTEAAFKKRMYDLSLLNYVYVVIVSIALAYLLIKFSFLWLLYIVGIVGFWIYKERAFKTVYKPIKIKPKADTKHTVHAAPINYTDRGTKRIIYGGIAVIAGLIITFVSYSLAANSSTGGYYFIWFGPVIFGGYELLKGVADLLLHDNAGKAEAVNLNAQISPEIDRSNLCKTCGHQKIQHCDNNDCKYKGYCEEKGCKCKEYKSKGPEMKRPDKVEASVINPCSKCHHSKESHWDSKGYCSEKGCRCIEYKSRGRND